MLKRSGVNHGETIENFPRIFTYGLVIELKLNIPGKYH